MAYPTLNANEINTALYNQIISQQIFNRIKRSGSVVDKARVDGSMYGDTKLYYSADIIHTKKFVQDSPDALNVLAVSRNKTVKTESIVIDDFRIAETTTDTLMTKRAWSEEGSFAEYNDLLNQMIPAAEYVHDRTNYEAFIGAKAVSSVVGKQNPTALTLTAGKEAQVLAEFMANLFADMTRPSRDYNDYGHMTEFGYEDINVVWNSKFVNMIDKLALPVIFHKEGLMEKFADNVVNEDYFGDAQAFSAISAASTSVGKPIKATGSVYTYEPAVGETMELRALEECNLLCTDGTTEVSFFAGEVIKNPTGKVLVVTDLDGKLYVKNPKIICKVFTTLPPFASAAELSSEFVNNKNHSTNRYLVFGRNTLKKFDSLPCVTVKQA